MRLIYSQMWHLEHVLLSRNVNKQIHSYKETSMYLTLHKNEWEILYGKRSSEFCAYI